LRLGSVPALADVLKATINSPASLSVPPVTLSQALEKAVKNYPSVQTSQARIQGNQAGITLARTAYLPHFDLLLQENRATRNNISGQLLPQLIIPSMTGPVINNPTAGSAWDSAAGALLNWEPFDFGLRRANVDLAKTQLDTAKANLQLTELNVVTSVSDAFFKVLSAKVAVQTQAAKVKRAQVFVETVTARVNEGLRPGVDLARAIAEAASAQIVYTQALGKEKLALAALAQAMGDAGQDMDIQGKAFWSPPTEVIMPVERVDSHPRLIVQKSTVAQVKAKEHSLSVSYRPKINVQGSFFGRGSGVDPEGHLQGGANGLVPTRANAAVGITVIMPVMNIATLRAQQRMERANESAELSRYNEMKQEILGAITQAKILAETASSVAEQTPLELKAARASEVQTRSRYAAGLSTTLEVADAERQLTQAEVEDALAKIDVWRSRLNQYLVQGDVKGFNNLVREIEQGANR